MDKPVITHEKYVSCDDESVTHALYIQDNGKVVEVPIKKIYMDLGEFQLKLLNEKHIKYMPIIQETVEMPIELEN